MNRDFLERSMPITTEDHLEKIEQAVVSIAGLGGNGGFAFLQLVRSGVLKFKLAEKGIFDITDLNRQACAFRSTLGRPKLDVYVEAAKNINPNVQMEIFHDGLTAENARDFIEGSTVHARVIDPQNSEGVKEESILILKRTGIPLFQTAAMGFGVILHAYDPKILIKRYNFAKLGVLFLEEAVRRRCVDYYHTTHEIPSTSIGNNLAGLFLASEILLFLLQGTDLAPRKPCFMPDFYVFDPLRMNLQKLNAEEIL